MAILRRNQHVLKFVGSISSLAWLAQKEYYMLTGQIETDLSRVSTAKIGSLKDPYYSVPTLLGRLKKYRSSFMYNVFSMRDSSLATRLNIAIDNLETDVSDGALRKQPFCIMLYGFPGTGKSSFAIQIAKRLMTDLYGEFKSSDMVTLNETDEYQSEFRTSHKVVLFDDIGASKYGLNDTKNPWRKVIDFVNNIKKTALNPNVEMKGKVYIEPDLVILTSNLDFQEGGQINGYIPAFEAILRRLSRIVKVKNHTIVQPLEPQDYSVDPLPGSAYLTRKRVYELRGGSRSPIDVPREEYIEELLVAFQEHNRDQERFIDKFNSYFDDYPGQQIQSNECLISQSGKLDNADGDDYSEAVIRYYMAKVNWNRYFVEWYHPLDENTDRFSLTVEGIVLPFSHKPTDLDINPRLFNEAYERIKLEPFHGITIKAESKTITDKLNFQNANPHPLSQSERLAQHCKEMKSKWKKLTLLKVEEVLPFPFYDILVMTKKATRPKQKAFYFAYAIYICVDLGMSAAQLFHNPVFTQSVPSKYVANRGKIMVRMERKITELRNNFPHLFDKSDDDTDDSDESEGSVSDVSQDSELVASSATSHMTPWIDESVQIKYLLATVKSSQPCVPMANVQLHTFGEIDLLFMASRSILVFELKSGLKAFNKAKHQALRYSRVMSALYPDRRIIGLTHTRIGFTMVCDLNASIDTEFEGFLRMIGYMDSTVIVET